MEHGRLMRHSRVTTRWLYSVFGVIILILIAFGITIGLFIRADYNRSAQSYLTAQAENLADFYERYIYPQYPDLEKGIDMLVDNYDDADRAELQVINAEGRCVYSSLGYAVDINTKTEDYTAAAESGETAVYKGKNENSERIMAVSVPVKDENGEISGIIRLISATAAVKRRTDILMLMILAVCLGIIVFVFLTNYYFIGTIINPLQKISRSADMIAKGDMSVRIENTYNDEVGDLCESINNMASEIAENEQMKNDFISSVSHELRTPMTAIKGWSETLMLCDPKEDTETVRRGLGVVNTEVERLSRMVEELLDFSRIQSGRLKLNRTDLYLDDKVGQIVNIMAERAAKNGISIFTDIRNNDIIVNADGDRLNQVFINIIDNAVKHSPDGQSIRVTLEADGEFAYVRVADKGEGISEEDLPRIKEKFYKGANSKQGTGLGLALADEIANLHGGELNIYSKSGEGTTVEVSLPLKKG